MKAPLVFLVDVDDTLLENDRIQEDLKRHMGDQFGPACGERFWEIQEQLFRELGYRDYLGALQRFRVEHPYADHLVTTANFLLEYPFADRLYPGALNVLAMLLGRGPTVILTDGDVVLQPRKVERSGLYEAVKGHVLIYVHKEEALADVERRYPAERYVLVDDKLRILTAVKQAWKDRVTTVFVRQGKFARDPQVLAAYPPADRTIDRIADLLDRDLLAVLAGASSESFRQTHTWNAIDRCQL
jgi:FMN phosphatase YigB (HAD superfamily)